VLHKSRHIVGLHVGTLTMMYP